jgi:hypothetical protein
LLTWYRESKWPFSSRLYDASLCAAKATRSVTTSFLSLPRIGVHAGILSALFVCFYWSMHHEMPWSGALSGNTRQARVEQK